MGEVCPFYIDLNTIKTEFGGFPDKTQDIHPAIDKSQMIAEGFPSPITSLPPRLGA